MSDVVIRAVDLSKVYRLYAKPHYRFLDMFGLLRENDGAYTEHRALDKVNLEVRRGERVAFIGRNGAGKTTLLKLVTSVIEPTSGLLEVAEGANALLQIGAGFHPDFTGRENTYSYLSHLGITGEKAARSVAEIIEFAELEEYIDQPVKTYSTGMVARLMFATSTAITPKLLVLDEILGVGDAYFSHKSYERIREMCQASGTTVLLVSHDIYSAAKLCERMVWIDRGRVMIDGPSATVMKAYEDSIRTQEEIRLRHKKQLQLEQGRHQLPQEGSSPAQLILEIQAAQNRPQPAPVIFREVSVLDDDRVIASLFLGRDAFQESLPSHLIREASSWSEDVEERGGQPVRTMLNHGSPFHKVGAVLAVPQEYIQPGRQIRFAFEYCSDEPCALVARAFIANKEVDVGELPFSRGEWTRHETAPLALASATVGSRQSRLELNATGVYGTGGIIVTAAAFVDPKGDERFTLRHGEPVQLRIAFRITDPQMKENAQVVVAFHRDGGLDVCRFITRALRFDYDERPVGEIEFRLPRLMLANGRYSVTIMVAAAGYYDMNQTVYFSLNPGVYCCMSKLFDVDVVGGDLISRGTIFVGEAEWAIR